MRAERKRKSYSIKLLMAFLGLQGVLLLLAPYSASPVLLSTLVAIAIGYLGFRRLDHPAPRPVLPSVKPGLLQLLGHTPEELVGKTVIGLAPVGVVFLRADGVMAEVNQRFAEILGYPRAELIGRAVSEISLPEECRENQALIDDAVSGRLDQYQLETRYRRKEGALVWVELSASILRDEKGRFLYAVAVVVDINERKRAEQALRESEQRFRTLAELSTDWFWEQDAEFRFSKIYGNAHQMGGTNPDDMIGTRRWDQPNFAMSEAQWSAHRAVLERRESFRDFEIHVLDAQGGMNYMEVSGVPVFDDAGRFAGYRGTGRKITERRRAEEALRESETRYALLVASMREGILVRERDGTISGCNPGAERIFGLPQPRLLGRNSLLPDVQYVNRDGSPFDVGRQPGHLALTTGQPADDVEFGIVRPDGSSRWVVASARPLFREGERVPYAAVVSLNDISERRAAERELERQRTFLRTVLDAVPNLIAVRDREHRYVMVNRAMSDFCGTTPRQMIGKPHSDFIEDLERADAVRRSDVRLLSSGGESAPYEADIADASGAHRWLQVAKRVIVDRMGEPNLVLVVGTDITERKRLQEELQRSVALRETILENSIVGIVFLDQRGRMVWTNRAAEQMFGIDRSRIAGKTIESFYLSREDYLATGAAVAREVLAGRTYEAELRMRRSDGTEFWVQLSGKAVSPGELLQGTVWVLVDITERKRAEEQLRESEARFRSLTELSSDWYWEQDENFRFIHTSLGVLERSGMTRDERIGKTRWEVPSVGMSAEQWAAHRADLEAHRPFRDFEVARIGSGGQMVYITTSGVPVFDAQGRFKGYRGVGRDINARKHAELALAEAKLRLEIALEGSSVSAWEIDTRTGEVQLSASWAVLLGTPPGPTRTTVDELRKLIHADDVKRARTAVVQCVKGAAEGYSIEHRVRTRNGAWKWILSRGRVLERDAKGRAIRVSGTNTDITERVERERELQQSHSLQSATLEATADGILVVDLQGRIASFNRNFAQMWHMPQEILVARDDHRAQQHAIDQLRFPEAFLARVREVYARPEATSLDTLYFKDSRVVERYSSPQMLGGEVVGRVWSFRDVTVRSQAEAALGRMNDELDRRVTERTAQLEASVKELEAFSYSVSHDLRAPLRAIDGYSQILIEEARGTLAPDARLCLDKISRNARRMAELIDRLLAFARYSRAPLERRAIDMAALVQSVIDEQPREAREIEFSVAPLKDCLADAQLLRHVFGNLVSNAVKYTRPREVARIEVGAFERDAATVYFVRDNGVGFDMRYVHKLFGVFQRLHSEKDFEGTGAGLAIVQRIVTRHGGRIWAEGEVGKGASFYFTLGSEIIAAAA
jgi:PAS domain S-box-containing protein